MPSKIRKKIEFINGKPVQPDAFCLDCGVKLATKKAKYCSEHKYHFINDEYIKKLSESHKGYVMPDEQKEKIRISCKGGNKTSWAKGDKRIIKFKENNPAWLGGKSFENYSDDYTEELRDIIRKRDGYVCDICGIHQDELTGIFRKLDVHHIDYDKENSDLFNLISLCRKCHIKTNFRRDYWFAYFNKNKDAE